MRSGNAIVTGANTGIGAVTARELARGGARVFLACRSLGRARPVLDAIRAECGDDRAELLELDLSSLDSVRRCAERFRRRGLPLQLLVNNAGLAGARGTTRDGFELAFGVNHLGHFLLTNLLLPALESGAPARVVTVASDSHFRARGIDFDAVRQPTRNRTGLPEYAVSKLANVLFSRELARRQPERRVTTYALHPGTVASDIWRNVPWPVRPLMRAFMSTEEEGARTTLHCATHPELAGETGLYYAERAPKPPSRAARDDALAAELWRRSAAWTGLAP